MRTKLLLLFFALGETTASAQTDSLPNITKTSNGKLIDPIQIHEVVVTGTRNETDIRHLPMTISVIDRKQIEQANTPSLLPYTYPTSTRTIHHSQRYHGLRCIGRCGRWHVVTGNRQRIGSLDGSHRRTPPIHGTNGTPYRRCLPIANGRTSGSLARTGLGIVRLERHGGRYQHRYPPIT